MTDREIRTNTAANCRAALAGLDRLAADVDGVAAGEAGAFTALELDAMADLRFAIGALGLNLAKVAGMLETTRPPGARG